MKTTQEDRKIMFATGTLHIPSSTFLALMTSAFCTIQLQLGDRNMNTMECWKPVKNRELENRIQNSRNRDTFTIWNQCHSYYHSYYLYLCLFSGPDGTDFYLIIISQYMTENVRKRRMCSLNQIRPEYSSSYQIIPDCTGLYWNYPECAEIMRNASRFNWLQL